MRRWEMPLATQSVEDGIPTQSVGTSVQTRDHLSARPRFGVEAMNEGEVE